MDSNQSGAIKIALQWAFLGWAYLIFAGASWGDHLGSVSGVLDPFGGPWRALKPNCCIELLEKLDSSMFTSSMKFKFLRNNQPMNEQINRARWTQMI